MSNLTLLKFYYPNLIILSDLLHHLVHHFHIKLHHFMIQCIILPFFKILQNTSKYKGLRSYINLWKNIVRKSINSFLYASISYKTSVFIGFSRPYFLFLYCLCLSFQFYHIFPMISIEELPIFVYRLNLSYHYMFVFLVISISFHSQHF